MKLDAFEQYIHDQYQGLEVAPPPAVESAVMGRLTRMKWARRVSGAALTLAVGAGVVWGWTERSVPAAYSPVEVVHAVPALEPFESVVVVAEPVGVFVEAPVAAPAEVAAEPVVGPRPDRVDPLPALAGLTALESFSLESRTLQSAQNEDQLWVISAGVIVED